MTRIPLELAKELKTAGFPQGGEGSWYGRTYGEGTSVPCREYRDHGDFYIPTLSELIEACGPAFISLVRADPGFDDNPWAATADGFTCVGEIEGNTPDEAVASLWFALSTPAKSG